MKRRLFLIPVLALLGAYAGSGIAQDKPDVYPRKDLRGNRGAIEHIAFHPNGKLLIGAGTERRIKLWDLETGRVVREIYPRGRSADARSSPTLAPKVRRIESIAFSPDGKMIAEVAADGSLSASLRLWNPDDGEEIRMLARDVPNLRCAVFAPDGQLIATNMRDPDKWGHQIALRNVETGKIVATLREDRLAATLLAFSTDGKLLASAGARKIHIWDVATRELKHTIDGHEKAIQSICFSPNGRFLASASTDDTVRIWKVETGKLGRKIEPEQGGVLAVAYNPAGTMLASAGADKTIKLWNPDSGKMYVRLWGHLDKVLCLAFSPDGKTLASGSRDARIALWDIEEPEEEEEEEDDDEDDIWEHD